MSCWLDYQSKYFHSLNATDEDAETIQTLIDAAVEFVEKFCGRQFSQMEHDRIYTVMQDGTVVIEHPPISHVTRICVPTGSWLTVENNSSSVTNASFATTDSSLILTDYSGGLRSTHTLTFAAYPTLTALASAIVALGHGWTGSVATGYGNYPSSDLLPQQHGNAKTENTLWNWDDYQGVFNFDYRTGVLDLWLNRGQRVRVVYMGGFEDVPEDIKQATANLVVASFNGPEGRIQSESLGGYSYSLAPVDTLPMNDKRILSQYRDRRA